MLTATPARRAARRPPDAASIRQLIAAQRAPLSTDANGTLQFQEIETHGTLTAGLRVQSVEIGLLIQGPISLTPDESGWLWGACGRIIAPSPIMQRFRDLYGQPPSAQRPPLRLAIDGFADAVILADFRLATVGWSVLANTMEMDESITFWCRELREP